MSKGWKEVARLGGSGARYPHILVDAHGWCLRLGPRYRDDEKYYASLPVLLQGLVEHYVRRRLGNLSATLDLKELVRETRDALHAALSLCHEALEKGGMEAHIRRSEALNAALPAAKPSRAGNASQMGIHAGSGKHAG